MIKKAQLAIILGIALVIWTLMPWIRNVPITWGGFLSFGTVVSGTYIACVLFDKFLWPCRLRGFCLCHGWLVACPDIRGTWKVELKSSWIDPATGKPVEPINCYYSIRQTSSTLEMHLMTPESNSALEVHRFERSRRTGGYRLVAVYTNEPDTFLRGDRSEIHRGTIDFHFQGDDPSHPTGFEGEYWTDRGTKGTMRGEKVSRKAATSLAEVGQLADAALSDVQAQPNA